LQVLVLLWVLLVSIPRPDVLLVQTPPAIPTLAVTWLVSLIRGCRVVVDWHNFGYTILALNMCSPQHWMVRVATLYERLFSAWAGHGNLCVTDAMRQWLFKEWAVHAHVLHDQPPAFFRKATVDEMHELFGRLGRAEAAGLADSMWAQEDTGYEGGGAVTSEKTLLTFQNVDGNCQVREDRPALVVSSTSWTEDEDFGVLLDALTDLDVRIRHDEDFPRILVLVTGKGPQRAMYEARMAKLCLCKVRIRTLWLEAADYPRLLGCCDLGVSLHTSSSGLDLPMKILDMFGASMPVCAKGFKCLDELVQDGHNGLVFESSSQLTDQMHKLLRNFPKSPLLENLRENVKPGRWMENWLQNALPVILPELVAAHVD